MSEIIHNSGSYGNIKLFQVFKYNQICVSIVFACSSKELMLLSLLNVKKFI